jgi:uncharacterized protein YecE (DUF72 family)
MKKLPKWTQYFCEDPWYDMRFVYFKKEEGNSTFYRRETKKIYRKMEKEYSKLVKFLGKQWQFNGKLSQKYPNAVWQLYWYFRDLVGS